MITKEDFAIACEELGQIATGYRKVDRVRDRSAKKPSDHVENELKTNLLRTILWTDLSKPLSKYLVLDFYFFLFIIYR